jgi:hypothetical protein
MQRPYIGYRKLQDIYIETILEGKIACCFYRNTPETSSKKCLTIAGRLRIGFPSTIS